MTRSRSRCVAIPGVFGLGLIGTIAFYGACGWVAVATVQGQITLGQMTMYLVVFRQGQTAVSSMLSAIGGMYEDNLYLSNLYDYLEQPGRERPSGAADGIDPCKGIAFDDVSFTYPGAETTAVRGITLDIEPGQSVALVGHNGSGKTTLVKLLAGLYRPDGGTISYQGVDLQQWDPAALKRRIGVIFQDFTRYQLKVGENIGVGDIEALMEEPRWREAARQGSGCKLH